MRSPAAGNERGRQPSLPWGSNAEPLCILTFSSTLLARESLHISIFKPFRSFSCRGLPETATCACAESTAAVQTSENAASFRNIFLDFIVNSNRSGKYFSVVSCDYPLKCCQRRITMAKSHPPRKENFRCLQASRQTKGASMKVECSRTFRREKLANLLNIC